MIGYVVMPEHVHLLISEPLRGTPSTAVQAVKLSFLQRLLRRGGAAFDWDIPGLIVEERGGSVLGS